MSATSTATQQGAADIIGQVNMLPPLPAVALQIIDQLGDEYVDGNVIADVVAKDPAIAGRLIGLANSAFFGLTNPATEMRDVVNRVLGADAVRTLAFALATQQAFDTSRCAAFDTEAFWTHSLRAAAYCKRLAAVLPDISTDARNSAFIYGLCHSLGLLVLAVLEPEKLNTVFEASDDFDYPTINNQVSEDFGASLEVLTAALARHWKMPDLIVEVYDSYANDGGDATSTAAEVLRTAVETTLLDAADDKSEPYALESRKALVHRAATYFDLEDTVIEIALALTDSEAMKVAQSAAAMSGV
ncbi:MAG: HDOD domain-containing protein [Pseudomonadota bacterium]